MPEQIWGEKQEKLRVPTRTWASSKPLPLKCMDTGTQLCHSITSVPESDIWELAMRLGILQCPKLSFQVLPVLPVPLSSSLQSRGCAGGAGPVPAPEGAPLFSQLTPGLERIPGALRRRKSSTGTPKAAAPGLGHREATGRPQELPRDQLLLQNSAQLWQEWQQPWEMLWCPQGELLEPCKALQRLLKDHWVGEEQPEPGSVPVVSLSPGMCHTLLPGRFLGGGDGEKVGEAQRGRDVPAEPPQVLVAARRTFGKNPGSRDSSALPSVSRSR